MVLSQNKVLIGVSTANCASVVEVSKRVKPVLVGELTEQGVFTCASSLSVKRSVFMRLLPSAFSCFAQVFLFVPSLISLNPFPIQLVISLVITFVMLFVLCAELTVVGVMLFLMFSAILPIVDFCPILVTITPSLLFWLISLFVIGLVLSVYDLAALLTHRLQAKSTALLFVELTKGFDFLASSTRLGLRQFVHTHNYTIITVGI